MCPMKMKATIISPMQIFVSNHCTFLYISFAKIITSIRDSYYNFKLRTFFCSLFSVKLNSDFIQKENKWAKWKKKWSEIAICTHQNGITKVNSCVFNCERTFISSFIWHSINIASHCIILLKLLNNVMINF